MAETCEALPVTVAEMLASFTLGLDELGAAAGETATGAAEEEATGAAEEEPAGADEPSKLMQAKEMADAAVWERPADAARLQAIST